MSYESAKYIYPSDKSGSVFSGGIVNNTPNTHLGSIFSPYWINFRLDGQSVVNRPWYQTFVTVDWTDYPRGVASYIRSDWENRIIVRQNVDATHDLVSITEAWVDTNIVTWANITVNDRMSFVNIADTLYCMNWTNFGKLDGTTYTDIPLATSHLPVAPRFWTFFAGCQWVSGFSTTTGSNKVFKSPNNTYEDFTASGSDVFTFPETVNALNVGWQAIFVFTTNTLHTCTLGDQVETAWIITFSFKPIQATEWAISNASVVSVGSNVYYLSSSNKINMIARGSNVYWFEVVELSDRKYKGINTLMQSLDVDQSDSFAQYYPEESLIKWFLKSRGAIFNDTCVIYDVEKDMFLQDTAKYFYDGAYLNGQVYTISTITPTVFRDEYGADDDWGGISFEYWTKAFDEWEFTMQKGYWESRTDVRISELASLTQEIWINSQVDIYWNITWRLVDTKTIGSANITTWLWGIGTQPTWTFPVGMEWASMLTIDAYSVSILRTKWNLNTRGYSIQFRYTNSAIGSRIQLLRLGYRMEMLPWITTPLTI